MYIPNFFSLFNFLTKFFIFIKKNKFFSFLFSFFSFLKSFKTPNKFLDLTKLNSTNIDSLSEWKTLKKDIIEEDTYCNSHYSQTSLLKKNKENLMFSSRISKTPSLNTKFGSGKKSNEETFVEMNKNQIENFFKEIELRKNEEEPPNEVINCEKLDSGKKKGHNHSSSKNSFQDKVKRLK